MHYFNASQFLVKFYFKAGSLIHLHKASYDPDQSNGVLVKLLANFPIVSLKGIREKHT